MKTLSTMVMAATLCFTLQAYGDNEIDGLHTNDFARLLPQSAAGLERHKTDTFPDKQELHAQYANKDNSRKAMVLVYTVDPKSNQAAKEDDPYLDVVINSAKEAMKKDGVTPEQHKLTSENGTDIRCVDGLKSGNILHSLCAAAVKGRIVEVQPLTLVDKEDTDKALKDNQTFVIKVIDSVVIAK